MKIFPVSSNRALVALVLSSFLVTSAYAGNKDCVINNGMSEDLAAYIKTTDNLLSRIEEESAKKQCGANVSNGESTSANADKAMSAVIGSMNERIGFSNFYTSERFYVDLALKTEVPKGITRDHEQLRKEIEHIKNTMEMVYRRCADSTVSTSNLSEDPLYSTSGKTFGTVLTDMLKNQVDMMNFYRETVLGDNTEDKYTFILVGNSQDFESKIQGNYGPAAFGRCIKESDFFKDIKESFNRIVNLG